MMMLLRFPKRHAHYPPGSEVWYHASIADVMVRAGLAEVVRTNPPQRQPEVETAVAAPVPEMAVTRARGRRWRRAGSA
jgi:hypothetical protein